MSSNDVATDAHGGQSGQSSSATRGTGDDVDNRAAAANRAAALLIEARRTRRWLDRLPDDCRPSNVEEATAIQTATVAALGERVAGWKVGGVMDGHVSYGVLLDSCVMPSPGRIRAADVPLLGIEGEIAFRFIADQPPRDTSYSYDEVAASVVAFPAIEVVATRYRDYVRTPVVERLADCMSNGAFVMGTELAGWRSLDLKALRVSLRFDDATIVDKLGGHPAGDPLQPAVDLVNELRASTGVAKGQVMTTGTCTGLNFATPGMHVVVRFDGLGSVELQIEP